MGGKLFCDLGMSWKCDLDFMGKLNEVLLLGDYGIGGLSNEI